MGSNGLPVWLGNCLEYLLVLDDPVSLSGVTDPFTSQCTFVIVALSRTFVCSSVLSILIHICIGPKAQIEDEDMSKDKHAVS